MNISFGILSGPGALLFLSCFIVLFSSWIVTLSGGLHVLLWSSSSLILFFMRSVHFLYCGCPSLAWHRFS